MRKNLNLKNESLTAAGSATPPPISKYGSADRPDPGSAKTQVPRDGGMLASGTTGGNFSLAVRPNGVGPQGTKPTADAVGEMLGAGMVAALAASSP